MKPLQRVANHSIEMEQALLGGIMMSPANFHRAEVITSPEAFFDPLHREIARHIWAIAESGKEPKATLVALSFGENEEVADGMTIRQYLIKLATQATLGPLKDAALVVQDLFARRQLVGAVQDAVEMIGAMPAYQPLGDVLDAIEEVCYRIRDLNKASELVPLWQYAQEAARLALMAKDGGKIDAMGFGLATLDRMLPPLMRRHVLGIAAASGAGKTAMALQILMANAEPDSAHLLIEQEMAGLDIANRAIARMGGPNVVAQLTGRFNEGDRDRIESAAEDIRAIPIMVEASGQLTLKEVRSRIRSACRRWPIRSVVIDHLQLIKPVGKQTNLDVVRDASNAFKDIAKENDVSLIVLAQLTRGAQKDMTHWRFSDQAIWGGDEFKQGCDTMIGIANPAQFLTDRAPAYETMSEEKHAKVQADIQKWQTAMEVGTLKMRGGARVGWKRIGWDGDHQVFFDE